MKIRKSLCFDDVLLVPQKSKIISRDTIDTTSSIRDIQFRLPIISSPMDTVTESDMAVAMAVGGGMGIIHRYNTIKEQVSIVSEVIEFWDELSSINISKVAAAIGVGDDFMKRATALYKAGARIICIDVAHGHHYLVEMALKALKDKFANSISIIAGNVATPEGYSDLSEWGADAVRLGIGGGSICSTRIQTGHGVPTLQTVLDCRSVDANSKIIADGGIKTTGDVVKALAAGADFVMLGSMLAGTSETPGSILKNNSGEQYKVYRGMASPEAQIAWKGSARSLEGISTTVPFKGHVNKILDEVSRNIKSGLSYSGAEDLCEFRAKAEFIRQSSSGLDESRTHILRR